MTLLLAVALARTLVARGKRAGLAGERSGLFMEQIRIIKEMRNECERRLYDAGADYNRTDIKPRYMVWENVSGAFSSNKGEDFRVVLEETAKVADKDAYVPGLEGGKWSPCGCILGNGWSIAWRLHDAQYYGVPQRRKRICLLADFNGDSAGRILFELQRKTVNRDTEQAIMDIGTESRSEVQSVSKGLSGDIETCGEEGKDAAADVGSGVEETGRSVVYGISAYDSNSMKSGNPHSGIYKADTSRTLDLNGGNPGCNQGGMAVVQGADMYNGAITGDIAATLNASSGDSPTHSGPSVVCLEGNGQRESHKGDGYKESDTMYTLNTVEQHAVCIENHPADSRVKISEDGVCQTLSGRMGTGGGNVPMVMGTYQETTGSLCASGYDKLGTQEAANDMFVVQSNWDGSQVSPTLTANNASGSQRMPDKDNFNAVISFTPDSNVKNTEDEVAFSMLSRDYKDPQCVAYGLDRASYNQGQNAQYNFSVDEEKVGTCVAKGPNAVCKNGGIYAGTQNKILCLLSETYGEETVEKWGIAILAALQSSEILQSGVHESSVSSETENRHKLDGGSLPCPSVVAGWLLRDMRKQQECGCSPHRRQSTEQQPEKSEKGMPELSQQNPQTCKEMFDMWEKGEGFGLLRQTLSEIQEVWQSFNSKGQSVHRCSIVRRLTPLEAERLQGFPDNWTNIGDWVDSKGKTHKGDSDSPRYKALGNSIALPYWSWMAERMMPYLPENPTMASLFDGISGFCLVFARAGVKPVFSSEIEEYPIAVAKKHFGDDEKGIKGDYEQYL